MNRASAGRLAGGIASAILALSAMAVPARGQDRMVDLDVSCYAIHAQADANLIREMAVRLAVQGEEINERLKGMGGNLRSKLPLYVLAKQEDFLRWGGKAGSGIVHLINEHRLVVHAPNPAGFNWPGLQEAVYQQFTGSALSGRTPMWVYAGMGTYYRFARWTGDGLATGVFPGDLLRQAMMEQKEGKAPALEKFLPLDLEHWYNDAGQQERFGKAWAMVHFMMHAEGGKYRQPFNSYVQDCAKGDSPAGAFGKHFGDGKAFAAKYEQWLASPQADQSAEIQTQATVATMTSFLARAHHLKLKFASVEEFFQAAKEEKVLVDGAKAPALWLPAGLLKANLQEAEKLKTWSLDVKKTPPALVLTLPDGTVYTGTFALQENRHPVVKVEKKEPPKATTSTSKPAGKT